MRSAGGDVALATDASRFAAFDVFRFLPGGGVTSSAGERRRKLEELIKVCILGAANPHTRRIMDAITALRYGMAERWVFTDIMDRNPNPPFPLGLTPRTWDDLRFLVDMGVRFANTISGSTKARHETTQAVEDAGGEMVSLIDPAADIAVEAPTAAYIQEAVVIQAECQIGHNVTMHSGALISHETKIGNHCFIGPHACICGRVDIGEGVYVGAGVTILPDVIVGPWATLGAGAVVHRNISAGVTAVGNPARVIERYIGDARGQS